MFNNKSKGKKILVVFYGDIQAYPPTMNMLNYLSMNNFDVTVICRGSNIGYSYLNECINIIALNKNISVQQQMYGSKILKCYLYMHFIVRVFLFLKIKTPKIILAYDPIALAISSALFSSKQSKLWYHNHDILESNSEQATHTILHKMEAKAFSKLSFFSLPSKERFQYFNYSNFKGNSYLLPNYPSSSLFDSYYLNRMPIKNRFNILFQGSIGAGHGIETIILILGNNTFSDLALHLFLKGKINNEYKESLLQLAKLNNVEQFIHFYEFSKYEDVPKLIAQSHLGIAIFTKDDIMNSTLGSASNKIYEYAAVGTPIIYFQNTHFETYFKSRKWAFSTDLSLSSITEVVSAVVSDFDNLSCSAYSDFKSEFYFEKNAEVLISELKKIK